MRRFTEKEEKIIIALHKKGQNCVEIAERLSSHKTTIRSVLLRLGYSVSNPIYHRKYPVDEAFFENIDSPEKAYFLGWVVSDGYNGTENALTIRIQEEDKLVLHVLKKLIKTKAPLHFVSYKKTKYKHWKNQWGLSIYSKKISSDVRKLGYDNTKSITAQYPQNLSDSLHSHFIRGLFEGDGCLSISKNKTQFYICGTKAVCVGVQKAFDTLKIRSSIHQTKTTWNVRVNAIEEIYQVMKWIYSNCKFMKLNRKYKKYLSLSGGGK